MRRVTSPLLLLLCAACAKEPLRAALDTAEGLTVGSPVYAAGVAIGTVSEVRVVGERAEVRFTLKDGHSLSMRADGCAMGLPTEHGALLLVFPGKELEPLSPPIPACEANEQRLSSLKKLTLSGSGLLAGSAKRFLDAIATQPETPVGPGPCEALSISRLRIEPVRAVPLLLPNGGRRLWLTLENHGSAPVALETTTFMDARGTIAPQMRLPEADDLFMSLALPAHTRRDVSAVFEGTKANQVSAVELEASFVDGSPGDGCRIRWPL